MTSVILNAQDHSIADLPPDILVKMFKELRGSVLIRLTTVCKNFNTAIGESKPLMNKIRLRVRGCEPERLDELGQLLASTKRKYEHIAISNIHGKHTSCSEFIQKHNFWSSLKLSTCNFDTLEKQIAFLSLFQNLKEIEFDNQIDNHHFRRGESMLSVHIPTLEKLKVATLMIDFVSTNLISLELTGAHENCAAGMIARNPGLEDLRLSYESLETVFVQPFNNMRIKRLGIKRLTSSEYITQRAIRNLEEFLKSQCDSIEELTVDWFCGIPARVRPSSAAHRTFRIRLNPLEDEVLVEESPPYERRTYDREEDAGVRVLELAFLHLNKLKKLVVGDKHAFLTNAQVPSVDALHLPPSYNIAELRLRFEQTTHSDLLFKKIVRACPAVTSLFVHAMDQQLLEFCAANLREVETLFCLSLRVDTLPNENTKFKKLQRLNFCECIIGNKPEIRQLKLFDRKNLVLGFLSGKSAEN